ncbi:hypothetical protein [Amycolatopsis coloradensis]|uniref:hypothetical protein n=1 Tax=Amycolatopsis coloradensis TaxID=76021 RepID=UPI0011786D17|nr:hypothetical protein [Amycolatopsis coloradensis]
MPRLTERARSLRAVEIAEHVAVEALPDWNTPRRIRERSQRLLPDPDFLAGLADQLREAVRPALELDHPPPAATHLAALAGQLHAAAEDQPQNCAAPGCGRELQPATTGRPRTYCGAACRQRAHRARTSNSVRIDR